MDITVTWNNFFREMKKKIVVDFGTIYTASFEVPPFQKTFKKTFKIQKICAEKNALTKKEVESSATL